MRSPIEQLIHKAAWLYYGQGLRQEVVAEMLGISRGTVVNYLKRARDVGAVSIRMTSGVFREDLLARRLEDLLGLETVWIIPDGTEGPAIDFSLAAGAILLEMVSSGQKIALAWGETVYDIVDALPMVDMERIEVMQMCGNLGAPFKFRPDQCTMELARRLRAEGENIYAPLILSTERLAKSLREEDIVRAQLERLRSCNLAVFSPGSCTAKSHVVACGAMTSAELAALVKSGAVGLIAGRIIGAEGREIDCGYNRRLISMDLGDLKAVPKRLCVARTVDKVRAVAGALRGGFVSHLVVTSELAAGLATHLKL